MLGTPCGTYSSPNTHSDPAHSQQAWCYIQGITHHIKAALKTLLCQSLCRCFMVHALLLHVGWSYLPRRTRLSIDFHEGHGAPRVALDRSLFCDHCLSVSSIDRLMMRLQFLQEASSGWERHGSIMLPRHLTHHFSCLCWQAGCQCAVSSCPAVTQHGAA